MIARLDRIQIAVRSRKETAALWERLFDAGSVRDDRLPTLGARRRVLRVGESELEILEADGLGQTAQHVSRSPTPIMAVGFAVVDLAAVQAHLDARAIHHQPDGHQIWLNGEWLGIPGMRVVLTQEETYEPAGLLTRLYEVTHLMEGSARAADRLAKVFDLDTGNYVPIESEEFGYRGTLARVRADRLDRVETVTPTNRDTPMGRFFQRRGPCLYMAFAECAETRALRTRFESEIPDLWVGARDVAVPDTLFVPPAALDRMLLGISRETVAWRWTGAPEQVR